MASTISGATMTVTIQEAVTINGKPQGNTNTNTYANIRECNRRIVTVPTVEKEILAIHASAPGAGTFVETDTRYIRITNKDDTNGVSLNLESASSNCWVVVLAGQSFMLSATTAAIEADDDTTIAAPTLQDVVKISAHSANPIDLDCYIALT